MNALLVYTHPNPASFNHAIYETVRDTLERSGHRVRCRELYADAFDPSLDASDLQHFQARAVPDDIAAEQKLIAWADLLVFVYPVWWFDRPARLKGWFDRVWSHGFAFKYGPDGPEGLLAGKRAIVFQTTGAPREAYAADGDLETIVRPMRDGTLRFCGIDVLAYETFFAVPYVSPEERADMLRRARTIVETHAPPRRPTRRAVTSSAA